LAVTVVSACAQCFSYARKLQTRTGRCPPALDATFSNSDESSRLLGAGATLEQSAGQHGKGRRRYNDRTPRPFDRVPAASRHARRADVSDACPQSADSRAPKVPARPS